ncbi:GNAT family N-acetyltransferase [Vibrio sp.]|uniref:GNAT family N-acetyltransferase n=1 Tax=Vibrio viridaestus TaxID=2487322 RepID=A0A3N9TAU2_9VIBR|nr:GNAT family N-acetyltransferase [Vibrio viridaestus]MDC0612634.1 GNAT family N-acetyltransferase [Vibrio sp.]RQW61020.1 GNAT family N-acetyltransferase [Vibrio viridaestus]
MEKLEFEQLDPLKLPLIQRFYKQYYPSTKPKRDEIIIIARDTMAHNIVAVVRFRQVDTLCLLTGMAVMDKKRGRGIGSALLNYCKKQKYLTPDVYCFSYCHLEHFYHRAGFHTISNDLLPPTLSQLYQRYTNSGKSLIAMQYL